MEPFYMLFICRAALALIVYGCGVAPCGLACRPSHSRQAAWREECKQLLQNLR
jgi:hypothetical protein